MARRFDLEGDNWGRGTPARVWAGAIGVAAAAAGAVLVPLAASAHASEAATPTITSVTFNNGSSAGSSTALVTINGSGFGALPNPKPAGNPQSYSGSGCFGVVYGGSLVLHNGDGYAVTVRGVSFSGTVSGL